MKYVQSGNEIIELLQRERIFDATGVIKMTLNDITVVVKQNDTIGNILQEWLGAFLTSKNVYFRPPVGQSYPDFYFSESNKEHQC
jgi:type II restriction enzyme